MRCKLWWSGEKVVVVGVGVMVKHLPVNCLLDIPALAFIYYFG